MVKAPPFISTGVAGPLVQRGQQLLYQLRPSPIIGMARVLTFLSKREISLDLSREQIQIVVIAVALQTLE